MLKDILPCEALLDERAALVEVHVSLFHGLAPKGPVSVDQDWGHFVLHFLSA